MAKSNRLARKKVRPPCMYTLEGEPNLKYKFLCAIDGNSLLKPVGENYRHGTTLQDQRRRRKDIWAPAEEVDIFKDEHTRINVRRSCILLVLDLNLLLESHEFPIMRASKLIC